MAEQVKVTITGKVISVDIEPVKPKDKNVNIHWTIDTAGWDFTANGIVIEDNQGQFSEPEKKNKFFKWKDKNDDKKKYKYTVNVTDGKETISLDPWIWNE